MAQLTTYVGWGTIIALGTGVWYLQQHRGRNGQKGRSAPAITAKGNNVRKAGGKVKKEGSDVGQISADQSTTSQDILKKNKRKHKAKGSAGAELSQASQAAPVAQSIETDENDDEMDNREFARQLQSAKTGTVLGSRPQAASRQKSVKQSKAANTPKPANNITNGKVISHDESAASSTAGADGDDDFSAANSSDFSASRSNGGLDISDMLEQPSAGPSVLRITEPKFVSQPKKQKKASTPVVTETKKQRQNRKKAEEKKAAREEDEKERRILLEKQRRTAREAEGRAAKDGSSFLASKPPASVWIAPSPTPNDDTAYAIPKVELLDTYDPTSNNVSNLADASVANATKSDGKWAGDLPSEEEQMRLLREENEWATVGSKKGRKNAANRSVEKPLAAKSANTTEQSANRSEEQPKLNQNGVESTSTQHKENQRVHEVEVEYRVGNSKVQETQYLQDSEWDV